MYWINGDYFKGNWENDKKNGEGTFYQKAKDKIYKGIWKNNKKIK